MIMSIGYMQADKVLEKIKVGDQVEFDYMGKKKGGKVKEAKNRVIKVSGQFGSTDVISQQSLTSSTYTTFLKVNGKVIIDNGKLK
tara:strand:- start:91 stop:345 length:255 start_codon:yes stop_codon:yes gene_type:complete